MSSEAVATCGLALALLGFFVNLIFKIREDRRQSEAHELVKRQAASAPEVKQFLSDLPEILRSGRSVSHYGGHNTPPPTKHTEDGQKPVEKK